MENRKNNGQVVRKQKPAGYFEKRFLTDEETDALRQLYISNGTIKPPSSPPEFVSDRRYEFRNGVRESVEIPIMLKTKEETLKLRQQLIADGTIIPKHQRKNFNKSTGNA